MQKIYKQPPHKLNIEKTDNAECRQNIVGM